MNITVLLGGPSDEREVSLVSGAAVAKGLREGGHTVFESDVSPENLSGLDHPADVVFPVLHGEFGEDGQLQAILEARNIPFVGSGSAASRIGIDKAATKKVWAAAGLPTPPYQLLERGQTRNVHAPCAVKAIGSGSSIDVFICQSEEETEQAVGKILARHPHVLIEKFIKGPELTVGLVEEQPLAPIRIIPKGKFFDFDAKYKAADTEHRFDTGLPASVIEQCRDLAKQANDCLGARDMARIDIMLDEQHAPYLLEINTLPGFTPKSLLPEAAAHAGIPFPQLVDRLARRAAARRGGGRVF
jgi:D-alanine-D-alanine ligase